MRAEELSHSAVVPQLTTLATTTDQLSSLAATIRDELARLCPALSQETRTLFAVQIAVAELRAARGGHVPSELGWPHVLN
jgi:hypothetical protein